MIKFIAKRYNNQSLKEQTISSLIQVLDRKAEEKRLLENIYNTKLSEGIIEEPEIYFVNSHIIDFRLLHLNKRKSDRGKYFGSNNMIVINSDYQEIEKTLLHEVFHFISIGYPNGKYQSGFRKNESWRVFNEVMTEYFSRIWIFEDEPKTVNETYQGPYLELKRFANIVTNEELFGLYANNRSDIIEKWINTANNISLSEWLTMFMALNSDDGFNRNYLEKIDIFLKNVARCYYEKED